MTNNHSKQTVFIFALFFLLFATPSCGMQRLLIRPQSPKPLTVLRKSPVRMIAVSPNERYLMTGQQIETSVKSSTSIPSLQILDLTQSQDQNSSPSKRSIEAAPDQAIASIFFDNGESVLTCSKAGLSRTRLKDGFVENMLIPEQRAKLISPTGDAVACVNIQGVWGIFSPKTQTVVCQFPETVIKILAFSPKEPCVACVVKSDSPFQSAKTRIVFWSYGTEVPEAGAGFEIDGEPSEQSIFSHDGRSFATNRDAQTVGIWDTNTGKLRKTSMEIEDEVQSLAFSPDGTQLAIGTSGKYGKLSLLDCRSGDMDELFTDYQVDGITAVCFNSSGETLYLGDSLGNVKEWDMTSKTERRVQ